MTVSDVAAANSAVNTAITNADSRANNALSGAGSFATALSGAAAGGPPQIGFDVTGNVLISVPAISAVSPSKPTAAINSIKNRVAVPPPDDFSVTDISVNYPTVEEKEISKPDVSFADAPVYSKEPSAPIPFIDDQSNAESPSESVPDKISGIGSYTIPTPPAIVVADFGETLPTYTAQLPEIQFSYVEPEYLSALKTAVEAKLLSDVVSGGTGLSPAVEDAIWERTRERDNKDYQEAVDKLNNVWSGRGFTLPDGVLAELQQGLINDDRNQRIERSRDILIKQAELAQANTHFTITSSLSLEQLKLNHANNVANRALEAQKSVVEFGIAYHNLKISDYNVRLERYKAKAVEVSSRLEAERLRLEGYKTELLEVEAKSALDKDRLANYGLDMERYDKLLKLFNAEQGAVQTALAIENLKIDFLRARIEDHRARMESQSKEVEVYLAQNKGELGKIDLYKAELDAESIRIGTLKTQTDIEIAKLDGDIKLQDLKLKAYLGDIEKYKAEVDVATTELGLEGTMYGHDINRYRADIEKEVAQLNVGVEALIKSRALDIQNAGIKLEMAKANLQAAIAASQVRVEAAKGLASTYASMAASAMSGITAIAAIESSGLSSENLEL